MKHQRSEATVKKTESAPETGTAECTETQEAKAAGTAPEGAPGRPIQLGL